MKIASFTIDGRATFGVVSDDGRSVLPAGRLKPAPHGYPVPGSVLDLIEGRDQASAWLKDGLSSAQADDWIDIGRVTLLAPVLRPSKIVCLALNNSANSDRIMSGPSHPALFIKPASSLVGQGADIEVVDRFGRVHPEPELAVVIGKGGKNIAAQDALTHVFGYTVHNDITGATMRGEDTFHYRAIHPKSEADNEVAYVDTWVSYPGRYKGSDTFSCMGPWIVTLDEIPDPHDLDISCSHKGKVITADNTANLTHKVPEVIAFVSSYMSLWPGDIISMGTALKKSSAGGAVQNIDLTRFGGPVSVWIERIGTLENGVKHLGQ